MIESVQKNVSWRAIPIAGLVGGTVFLIVVFLLTPTVLEVDTTLTLRYFASLVLGSEAVSNASTSILVMGIFVHYLLSILFAGVIAIVVHRWGLLVGLVGGALMGLCLYLINLYTMTYFFDWFFAINSTVLLVAHVLYGATAGAVYEMMDRYDQPLIVVKEGA